MRVYLIILLLLICDVSASLTVGVSPSNIVQQNLLIGSEFTEDIKISSNEDIKLEFEYDSRWIKTFLEDDILHLSVTVPNDTSLGVHRKRILIKASSNKKETIKTELVLPVDLLLNVTDRSLVKYRIKQVKVKDSISLVIDNLGNVESGPKFADIEIVNRKGIRAYNWTIDKRILPFSRDELRIPLKYERIGNNIARIRIYDNSHIETFEIPFEIEYNLFTLLSEWWSI